jgi:hypothetical protein
MANKHFQNMAEFRHFGELVANYDCVDEKIKSRINSGNA